MAQEEISTPAYAFGALLLVAVVVGVAFAAHRSPPAAAHHAAGVVREVATIAHRVERIRGVRFKRLPRPVVVTPAQTQATELSEVDRDYPAARRQADTRLLEILGLVPPDTDLRKIDADVSAQQVAGFYDTRRKRLAIVDGPAAGNRVLTEITLAHELNHALEDQRFKLRDKAHGADDGASAYDALVEGTATAVMSDYTQRYIPPGAALGSAFAGLASAPSTKSIPPYIQRSLEFSYTGGEAFVDALRRVAGGWKLVNFALTRRPPASTEQIMHPLAYMRDERPVRVPIAPPRLGSGWRRVSRGTMGEWDTRELLKLGVGDVQAANAAAGWGGGSYEMWTKAGGAAVVVVRWAWDTPRDEREFVSALRAYAAKGVPEGEHAAMAVRGGRVMLTLSAGRRP